MIRRRHRNPITSQTLDLISDLVWAGPNLDALRDRLIEIVNDNELWAKLKEFEAANKVLDLKLTKLINKAKKG